MHREHLHLIQECLRHDKPVGPAEVEALCARLETENRRSWAIDVLDYKFGTSWYMSTRDITHTVWGMGFDDDDRAPRRIGSGVTIDGARINAAENLVVKEPVLREKYG